MKKMQIAFLVHLFAGCACVISSFVADGGFETLFWLVVGGWAFLMAWHFEHGLDDG